MGVQVPLGHAPTYIIGKRVGLLQGFCRDPLSVWMISQRQILDTLVEMELLGPGGIRPPWWLMIFHPMEGRAWRISPLLAPEHLSLSYARKIGKQLCADASSPPWPSARASPGWPSPPPAPAPARAPPAASSPTSSSTARLASWPSDGYQVNNDEWSGDAGPQTIWADSYKHWGVTSKQGPTTAVKTYPDVGVPYYQTSPRA